MNELIYLDNAATTPTDQRVLEAMYPYFTEYYGNPSTFYSLGRKSRNAVEEARSLIAALLGAAKSEEIVFTSGGSESNNLVIKGLALQQKSRGNHIVTTKIEHNSVLKTCQALEESGFSVTYLPVDRYGMISLEDLNNALTPQTTLITIMTANNEVGTIQPVEEIAALAFEKGIVFHTDAVQAVGTLEVNAAKMGVDALSVSSHKFYGPKGVGAALVKKHLELFSLIHGGEQENHLRAGTENVPGIVGMAKALELAYREREERNHKIKPLRDKLIKGVLERIPEVLLTGHPEKRTANSASFAFKGVEAGWLLRALAESGICVSSGSACSSKSTAGSHVLMALGLSDDMVQGSLRITIGKHNREPEIDFLLDRLVELVTNYREAPEGKIFCSLDLEGSKI